VHESTADKKQAYRERNAEALKEKERERSRRRRAEEAEKREKDARDQSLSDQLWEEELARRVANVEKLSKSVKRLQAELADARRRVADAERTLGGGDKDALDGLESAHGLVEVIEVCSRASGGVLAGVRAGCGSRLFYCVANCVDTLCVRSARSRQTSRASR
jgi:hypothetical protein